MRSSANASKATTALNRKYNLISTGRINGSLHLIPSVLKMGNLNFFFFFIFSKMMETSDSLKPVNTVGESKTLCENFYNREHIF